MLTIVCRLLVCSIVALRTWKMCDILKIFGERVREERNKKHLSQEDLADKAGLHRTYIGMIERAEKNITLKNIHRIANALDISITELLKLK